MDAQIWDKIFLLIAGGALTALGAWVNDLRNERRRKSVKLEEAYLNWLNTQSKVNGQLKELTRLAEKEPDSVQSHELLLEKFENISSDIHVLTSALNLAFIYERSKNKKVLLENQLSTYVALTELLSVIIRHHKTHLEFHKTINESNSMAVKFEKLLKFEADNTSEDLEKRIKDGYLDSKCNRDEAVEHLSKCTVTVLNDAKELSEEIRKNEADTALLRRMLVEGK